MILFFCFSGFVIESKGQCDNCDVIISSNNNGGPHNTPSDLADGATICITTNRSFNIDLRGRNDLKICISENASFTGQFSNYNTSNTISIDVYGTYRGNLTLNNNNSQFNIFPSGTYDNSGTLSVTRGNVNNQGTISRPVILSNSSTLLNSGSFTGSLNIENPNGVVITNSGDMNLSGFNENGQNYIFNSLSGSNFSVGGNREIRGVWNIEGEVNFGGNLTLANTGSSGVRVNLAGEGKLNIGGDLITNRGITASGNSEINVARDFISANNGENSNGTTLNNNASLNIGRNAEVNRPLIANNNSSISINGNLTIPNNAGASASINNESSILVGGNTSIRGPLRFRDNAVGTFSGNVSLHNVGNSILDLQGNADVLIQSNLTAEANGSTVLVKNTSSLVICSDRPPIDGTSGNYPPISRWGNNIDPSSAYYGGCRILPVEYLSLGAIINSEKRATYVTWTTAKEWENSHFEIERAIDQVKNFEKIGEVEGTGFADDPVDYSFSDEKVPLSGGIAYYRLKQVDFNGDFQYSEVLSVRIPTTQSLTGIWRAYPNPTKGNKLNIDLVNSQEYSDEPITARLVSSLVGSVLIEGNTIQEVSEKLGNKLQTSPNGLYVIEVHWGQKREYLKVLKN